MLLRALAILITIKWVKFCLFLITSGDLKGEARSLHLSLGNCQELRGESNMSRVETEMSRVEIDMSRVQKSSISTLPQSRPQSLSAHA